MQTNNYFSPLCLNGNVMQCKTRFSLDGGIIGNFIFGKMSMSNIHIIDKYFIGCHLNSSSHLKNHQPHLAGSVANLFVKRKRNILL